MAATKRVLKEIKMFNNEKPPHALHLHVPDRDMFTAFFLIEGPSESPFYEGQYVVELKLPRDYPSMPPRIRMKTPNGRFAIDTDICTTFSSFHPEKWSPIYTFNTIITSLISFMTDIDDNLFIGRIDASNDERRKLALASKEYNTSKGFDKMWT